MEPLLNNQTHDYNKRTLQNVIDDLTNINNKNRYRMINIHYTTLDMDMLVALLKLIATTQYDSLYSLEFRNAKINNTMLKVLFNHIKCFSILHNILVVEDKPIKYDQETINYCKDIVANNGPVCTVIYDGNLKYNLDPIGREWCDKNGDYTRIAVDVNQNMVEVQ